MKKLFLILTSLILLGTVIDICLDLRAKEELLNTTKTVDVTAFTPCKEQTDLTPFITASNKHTRQGGIAVSRDLFKQSWTFGKKVYIEGLGIYTITDLMNKKWKNRIDIFMDKNSSALKFGKRKLEVTLL